MKRFAASLVTIAVLGITGCNSSSGSPMPGPTGPVVTPIQHIVIMVEENRSFNNMFAGYPGADTALKGACKPAAWCPKSGLIALHPVKLESTGVPLSGTDIDHSHHGFEVECAPNGKNVCQNDGFNLIRFGESGNLQPAKRYPYAYVDRSETAPYWKLAQQYALADHMFFTETASSFISHQMMLSGTVALNDHQSVTDQPEEPPWGCWSPKGDVAPILDKNGTEHELPGVYPCFKWASIADLLDAKSVPWLFYVDKNPNPTGDFSGGVWNGFAAIHKIFYGPDFKKNISSPNTNVFSDITNGTLPSVSWVIPSLYDSDHPASGCNGGPWWVTKVVNALGTSQYWNSTAIVLLWDDWGGWYDNVPPPQISYTSLGFRVPMIVISPYAKPSYISSTQYDFGSVLKFVEETFDLGSLGTTDAPAASMENLFNFTQAPITFKPAPEPSAMPCKNQVTNPKQDQELIEHDGGVPE
jgi:phospholipase C